MMSALGALQSIFPTVENPQVQTVAALPRAHRDTQ